MMTHISRAAPVILTVLLGGFVTPVWAQTAAPAPTAPPPGGATPAAPDGGWGATGVAVVVVVVGLLVIVGVLVKMFDLKRKREAEAVYLQAQISDALLREAALFRLPITPTAHIPFWAGSPVTIELSGQVPTREMRDLVVRIAEAETARTREDFRIDDRIGVVPSMQPAPEAHRAA
jgi:hypothetical protein